MDVLVFYMEVIEIVQELQNEGGSSAAQMWQLAKFYCISCAAM